MNKNINDKCKKEPKLFYKFSNGKIKQKESKTRLKKNTELYEDLKEMRELNKSFQKVFTTEFDLKSHKNKADIIRCEKSG